jgi:ribose/xylose/arabinose/galactoside ABC-type transport system permease subunit
MVDTLRSSGRAASGAYSNQAGDARASRQWQGNEPSVLSLSNAVAWIGRGRRYAGVAGALILLVVIFGSLHPFFLGGTNIKNILTSNADLMLVAVGMTFAMVGGGFDLSVGSIMVATAVILYDLLSAGVPQVLAMVFAVLCAGLGGALINGVLIGYARLNFLVVTLGSMSAIQGLVYVATNGNTLSLAKWSAVTDVGSGSFLGIANPIWFMIGAVVISGLFLHLTKLGRAMYAVGGNREAARVAGIRTGFVTMMTYGASGLFAGLAGLVLAGQLAAASPTSGSTINLIAGAAVLLGGTSFSGGEGGVFGSVLGVLLIGSLENGLGVIGVSDFWQGVVTGVVLVGAVALDQAQRMRGGKARRLLRKGVSTPWVAGPSTANGSAGEGGAAKLGMESASEVV